MSHDDRQPAAPQPESTRRRWFQFSLRSLLVLVALVALAAMGWRTYVAPYVRQRETIELIEKLHGTCQTAEGPVWLRRLGGDFQNIVQVNLADCDDPAAYLDHVSDLPVVELLIVGGPAFTDDHARRLHRLHTLQGLVLDSTSVTDEGLAALGAALPQAHIYASQRRAIAALASHALDLKTHVAPTLKDLFMLVGADGWFEEATWLNGWRCTSDDDLATISALRSLQQLHLFQSPVSDAGLAHVGKLKRLQILGLAATRVSDTGLEHLQGLTEMQSLDLARTAVSDAGLEHLTELSQLRRLDLESTSISDAGLEHLKGLSALRDLCVRSTRVTPHGVAALRHALPQCDIQSGFD